jgi:hypothetical protein
MNTNPRPARRRGLAAGVAAVALVSLSACGTEVSPPKEDIGTVVKKNPPVVATLDDCLDTTKQPKVTTCPYPVKSGDRFQGTRNRMTYDDEYGQPGRN